MRAAQPEGIKYPKVYQHFKNSQEIADVINRSTAYVKKALKSGFTEREEKMLEARAQTDLFGGR